MQRLIGIFWVLLGFAQLAHAELVELQVRPGIVASAAFAAGDRQAPAVLILHGFLQTHEFPTVRRLHHSLAESGFSVLSPTLSLGIHKRAQSLECEALHLHTLHDDVQELKLWVDWLRDKTGREVVLIGHSAGGLVMTRYLADYPDAPVAQGIMISLSYLEGQEPQSADSDADIAEYSLVYCERYPTTAQAYHSYVDWGTSEMLDAVRGFRNPVSIILGSGDRRISQAWRDTIAASDIDAIIIQGADHFFDNQHEFDLLDAIEQLLPAD